MEARALPNTTRRFAHRPVEDVIVRVNAPLFYGIGVAALLESNAAIYAERMLQCFAGDRDLCAWLRDEWRPRKLARSAQLRQYIETKWPELDWAAAQEHYQAITGPEGGPALKRPTAAHEALARCVAAAQSALFYRCLSRWADDARLRELARAMALEEAASLPYFRAAFQRRARVQKVCVIGAWCTARTCIRRARDRHVALAFSVLAAQWGPNTPFPAIEYPEFIARMRAVILRRGEPGLPERILFKPWFKRPRLRIDDKTSRAPVLSPMMSFLKAAA
jgi:hypothetical protein